MIAVTGATGHLGRLTLLSLLERGIPTSDLVALVRDPSCAADLATRGVQVRQADYHQPDTLRAALEGVDRLLLVSSNDFNDRVGQHRHVVEAARDAGVKLLAYTSFLHADTTPVLLAGDHKATEEFIRASGVPFVFLRNGWYVENYTGDLEQTLARGVMTGSAGQGRFTPAARQDYAAAAAAVLATDGQEGRVYELGGDEALTMSELAALIGQISGREVTYTNLPVEEYVQTLVGFGLPEGAATVFADADAGIARGNLNTDSGDLRRLIGRPTTPVEDVLRGALTVNA